MAIRPYILAVTIFENILTVMATAILYKFDKNAKL